MIYLSQVKFNFDAIDETNILEKTLNPRVESFGRDIRESNIEW